MAKKPKKPKFNNKYNVRNELADEIRLLGNSELVARAALEYKNWLTSQNVKKADGNVLDLREQIKGLKEDINNHVEVVALSEKLKSLKDELLSEEQARLQEELKNANQPHNEDIKSFKGVFQVAMDEVARRKDTGSMK